MKGLKKCRTMLSNCQVSSQGKSCINCRYRKCLAIGMTPELIQGKRKREEAEVRNEEAEETEERPDDERVSEPVYDMEQHPIQEQPLKLVRKNTPPPTSDLGKSFFWN